MSSFRSISTIDRVCQGEGWAVEIFHSELEGHFYLLTQRTFFKVSKGRRSSYRVDAEGVGSAKHPWNSRVQLKQGSSLEQGISVWV